MSQYRVHSPGVVAAGVVRPDIDVLVRDGRVVDLVRADAAPAAADWPVVEAPGFVAPAFVDIHTHGYGGVNFADCDLASLDRARAGLYAQGVGAFLVSLASMPPERLEAQLAMLTARIGRVEPGQATVLGVHLEGPYLSVARRGAHPPALLRTPDAAEIARWLARAPGGVRQVTLAPELDGYAEVAQRVEEAGATVALGHSNATTPQALDAMARGAHHVTHLWNGMSGLAHRDAGLVAAALEARGVTVELIADGIHVDPAIVDLTYRQVGPERLCLVTDAMAATGVGDGVYGEPGRQITVSGGVARTEDGALAGSTLTLARAIENVVGWGVAPLATAVYMATWVPAQALALTGCGTLRPGTPARLVALSGDGRLLAWPERALLEGAPAGREGA